MNNLKLGQTAFIKCEVTEIEGGSMELTPIGGYAVPIWFPIDEGSIIPMPQDAPAKPPKSFEVDDEVYSLDFGSGKVIKSTNFKVSVEFNIGEGAYSENGCYFNTDANRTLFHKFENVRVVTEPTHDPNEQQIKDLEREIRELQNKLKERKKGA